MVTLTGIILLALGISLSVAWRVEVLSVLQGLIPLALLFGGAVLVLVGYSEMKAAREYARAIAEDDSGKAKNARSGQSKNDAASSTPTRNSSV